MYNRTVPLCSIWRSHLSCSSVLTSPPASSSSSSDLEQAWETFRRLLPAEYVHSLAAAPAQTLYTPWVVLWLLIYQRLHDNAALTEAVDEFKFRFPEQALPDCSRADDRAFSSNTGAYSRARCRLEVGTAQTVADHVADTLTEDIPPAVAGRRCFLFDGSTVLLQPVAALRQAFPGASNQHGESPFPVLHLALAHELGSGMALRPEHGAMYGPDAVSEVALARRLMDRLPAHSLLLGDENFGIFAFAWEAQEAGHRVVLRLTKARFQSLCRQATAEGPDRWQVTWRPSKADRRSHPELPANAQVSGWLIRKEIDHPTKGRHAVFLFETEPLTNEQAAALYRQRQQVESDIRDMKVTLLLSQLQGRSVAMVEKEVALASVAFNLVNQTRRLAAPRAGVPPRRLSFKGVWSILKAVGLHLLSGVGPAEWQQTFDRALDAAAQRKLPNRNKQRHYPREVHMRRRNYPPRKREPSNTSDTPTAELTHPQT